MLDEMTAVNYMHHHAFDDLNVPFLVDSSSNLTDIEQPQIRICFAAVLFLFCLCLCFVFSVRVLFYLFVFFLSIFR